MTTLNKTLEDLKFEFSDINGILRDAFSSKEALTLSILNNRNKQAKINTYHIQVWLNMMNINVEFGFLLS